MDTDIKPTPERAVAKRTSPNPVVDVVTPPEVATSPPKPSPDTAITHVSEKESTERNSTPSGESSQKPITKSSEQLASPATPIKPKQSSSIPLAAIVGAVIIFVLLVSLAYLAYSKG